MRLFNNGKSCGKTIDELNDSERPNHFRNELGTLAGHLRDKKALQAQLDVSPPNFSPEKEEDLKNLARSAARRDNWRQQVREAIQQATENEILRAGVTLLLRDQDAVIEGSIQKLGVIAGRSIDIPEVLGDFLGDWQTPLWIRDELGAVPGLAQELQAAARRAVA